jgi:hypothetical protein
MLRSEWRPAYIHMFLVKTMTIKGKVVPITLARRQYFLPILSEIFPNNGQAMNARSPLIVSTIPTKAYVDFPKESTNIPGIMDLVILRAKYS